MEIVIKIPDLVYEEVMAHYREYPKEVKSANYFEKLVLNGTPLPEHHGRLKDVDWIDENCNHHYSERDGSWCYTWRDIDNAPTIIEGSESE